MSAQNIVSENYINSGSYKLWTKKHGSIGMPIVLCNGGPGCCDYLEPVAELLDNTQTIHFEHRGCGRSDVSDKYSIQTSLEDLEAVRQYYGFEKWIVLGHSWGADLALFYALEYPQHTKAFICLAGGRVHNDRDWHAEYRQGREANLESELDYAFPHNLEVNKQVNLSWKSYIKQPDLLARLSKTTKPALFVYGKKDIRPSWAVEQVANLLPEADMFLFDNADHHLWLSDEASVKVLKKHMNEFIQAKL